MQCAIINVIEKKTSLDDACWNGNNVLRYEELPSIYATLNEL